MSFSHPEKTEPLLLLDPFVLLSVSHNLKSCFLLGIVSFECQVKISLGKNGRNLLLRNWESTQSVFLLNGFRVISAIPSYHIAIDIIHVQFLSIIFTCFFTFPEQSHSSLDCIFCYSCNILLHVLHHQLKIHFFFSNPWPKLLVQKTILLVPRQAHPFPLLD